MSDNLLDWLDLLPKDKALKAKLVAEKLDLSPSTIYNLLNKGEISGFRVGKSWRIFPAALRQYLLKNSTGNKDQQEV